MRACVHARRRAAVMAANSLLLSRAELWGYGDDFTKQQNFAGPDNFFHSRYGATMGHRSRGIAELLPVLHVGRVGDLSRAGLRSVFSNLDQGNIRFN